MKFIFIIIIIMNSMITLAVNVGEPIKASDINFLRNQINSKRTCYGLEIWPWTDTTIAAGTSIKAIHIQDIRNAVNNLYSECGNGACAPIGLGNVEPANRIWTDSSILNQTIKAIHIVELKNTIDSITCSATTYSWNIGPIGVCNGGSGNWVMGSWSSCAGGSTNWIIGAWSACSTSCDQGVQNRNVACEYIMNSGTQNRMASCNFNTNSGSAQREVTCLRSDGSIVADSWCSNPKPLTTVSCTPTNDVACGEKPPSTQNCTPSVSPSCGSAPTTSQTCNIKPCTVGCPAGTVHWPDWGLCCSTSWSCYGCHGEVDNNCIPYPG